MTQVTAIPEQVIIPPLKEEEDEQQPVIFQYFENDNKDRYFKTDQIEFYEKTYKPNATGTNPKQRKFIIRK